MSCAASRLRLVASREMTGSRFGRPGKTGSVREFLPAPSDALVESQPDLCFSQGSLLGERDECWPTGRQFSVSRSRSNPLVFAGSFCSSSATVGSEGMKDNWLSSWRGVFPIMVISGSLLMSPKSSATLFEASLLRRTVSRDASSGGSDSRGDMEPG